MTTASIDNEKRRKPLKVSGAALAQNTSSVLPLHPWSAGQIGLKELKIISRALAGPAIRHDFELELLAFREGAQPSALDSGDVHEHIGPAALRLNEAEALFGIEPLDCTDCHDGVP
jgi:hypothetical protein